MAEWKKVLISGSNIHVAQISASDVPTVDSEDNILAITTDGGFKQIAQSNIAGTDTMGSGFIVSADTNTAVTTITENDTLTLDGGTNIATTSNPDGTITIAVDGTVANATNAVNATTATTANNVATTTDAGDLDHYFTYVDSSTAAASTALKVDPGIKYNPNTNILTVEGGLVVNGTTTTIDTTNLTVEDRFILLASGSTTNGDGGIVVEKDVAGTGTALFWDNDTKSWAIDFAGVVAGDADPAAVDGRLVVVEVAAGDPGAGAADYPLNGLNTNGHGQMWVNNNPDAGESGIWIYG